MDPTASREERQLALGRAAEHQLDVAKIAGLTVQMVLAEPFLVRDLIVLYWSSSADKHQ